MHDGHFRNCGLPTHWKKACQILLNPAEQDDKRREALLSAFKKDCKLPPILCSPPYNLDLFAPERLESLACLPETTDFGREVLRLLRFGKLEVQVAVEQASHLWLDAICRKAESVCPQGEARTVRQRFAWGKCEITHLEIAKQLCQTGKFEIPKSDEFDIDAHLS